MSGKKKTKKKPQIDKGALVALLVLPWLPAGIVAFINSAIGRFPPTTFMGWAVFLGCPVLVYAILAIQWSFVLRGRDIPNLGSGYNGSFRAQFDHEMHTNPTATARRSSSDDD